jgi:hypothetical protein
MYKKCQIPWNKGKKGLQVAWNKGKHMIHSGSFKKGHKGYTYWKGKKQPHMEGNKFRVGCAPWNKGLNIKSNNALEEWRKSGGINWNKGKKFPYRSGKNHFNWKNGRCKQCGYVMVKCPDHPLANKKGYIFEHRLVMEKMLGRYLKKEERAHHINNIKDDNRPENLMYFKNESEHQKFHQSKN